MQHVFISYVRDNAALVDRFVAALRASGVDVWLDREQIRPGERWRLAIRRAIESGAFFIACFSDEYATRDRTYMNEELVVAIEELRRRPYERTWFIPVLLSGVAIPDRPIGAGESLADLQFVNLAADWEAGLAQISK